MEIGRATRETPGGPPLSIPWPGKPKARGLSSFHPVASRVHERTQPGNNPRQGVPVAWCPLASQKHTAAPLFGSFLGPATVRGAEGPAFFSKKIPEKRAVTLRIDAPAGAIGRHPPLKGVRPEKIQRKRGQKNEIHHQAESETGGAIRPAAEKGVLQVAGTTKKQRQRGPRRRRC